jgi:hypothetical protein
MQPVPVQRSRTRSSGGRFCAFRRRPTRCETEAAVSALLAVLATKVPQVLTHRTLESTRQVYTVSPSRQSIRSLASTAAASLMLFL